ncbi:hypothetical protein I8752_29260 [Nostocaceae cyanobacterium CENA369]|uniref:KGK family protein n=1 Tax=Dendronalium phyllosphericum CENA369 TaxID=1725256 RepID=A0A8J7LMD2_9NOST|nr:KGK domain-containing protein [Dendronalium phyllosphericum]MBH8576999.1 hypothetical protein [Dendronalium phyllosphericum CENA369]
MSDVVILKGDEVISMSKEYSFVSLAVCKFEQMDGQIKKTIEANVPNYTLWTNSGVNAQVLCPGENWQKGKLKLVVSYHVEFIPESELPSDEPVRLP